MSEKRIHIRVIPRASAEKVEQIGEDAYKVWVTAAPDKGQANKHVIRLLSRYFSVPKGSLRIIKGPTARDKIITMGLVCCMVVWGFFAVPLSLAQDANGIKEAEVTAEVDRTEVTIGDTVRYVLRLEHDEGIRLEYPELAANLDEFQIRDYKVTGPTVKKGRITYIQEYLITTFTLGEYTIPPVTLSYTDAVGVVREITAPARTITVKPVIRRTGDGDDVRDIKGTRAMPRDLRRVWWVMGGIVLIGGGIAAALYILRLRRRNKEEETLRRPPEDTAREELDSLCRSSLLAEGKLKEYYDRLSDIIRRYSEGRWSIVALDRTTWEFYHQLRRNRVDRDHVDLVYSFLKECDLVKFAKYAPPRHTIEEDTKQAYHIVEITTPAETVQPGDVASVGGAIS